MTVPIGSAFYYRHHGEGEHDERRGDISRATRGFVVIEAGMIEWGRGSPNRTFAVPRR
jgi:hypothetical protein